MENFKDILKDLVMETNLSLRQLEKESGISAMQYSRYLRGSIPTIPIILRMAKYFQCSLDYMFGLDNNKKSKIYKTYDYDMSNFVERYQTLLRENNTSNYKFAKNLEFNESIIRHWKNGSTPRLDVIYHIAKELGGSIDELIGRF